MSIFEYMATIVAIVLGLAAANFLNKFSKTVIAINWRPLGWFFSQWCLILLICLLGFFWSFWRVYNGVEEISIWEFIIVPFFSVVCFFLSSVFLPTPEEGNLKTNAGADFIEARKPFFVTLTVQWSHFMIMPLLIDFNPSFLEVVFGFLMIILSFSGIFLITLRAHKLLLTAWSITFLSQEAAQFAIGAL